MPYLQFNNIDAFNAWHETIMETLGIPDGLGTVIYSELIVHPVDNTVMASIDERTETGDVEVFNLWQLYELGYLEFPDLPLPF